MSGPTLATVKRLFALSSNRCAFPGCETPIIEINNGAVIGEISHIRGTKNGSARNDPHLSDEEKHEFNNLILLCPTHHAIVDSNENTYTVVTLIEYKRNHESSAKSMVAPENYVLEELLADYITKSSLNSPVKSVGQTGGQTASVIINVETTGTANPTTSRPRGILSNLVSIPLANSEEDVDNLQTVHVESRDVNQKLVRIPEFDENEFRKIVESLGYSFNEFEGAMSFVTRERISNSDAYEEEQRLEMLRTRLKNAQLHTIDQLRDTLEIKSEIINLLSSTISRANQKFKFDAQMTFLLLKSLLGSLAERGLENLTFLDDQDISSLVRATLSDAPEDVRHHLDSVFRDIIIKIRKLYLLFCYDLLSVQIINYHLKPGEFSKLALSRYIEIGGDKLRVFKVPAYGKYYYIAVDGFHGDIITFALGKKRRTEIDPVIHMLFLDRISFHIQREFLSVMAEAFKRVKNHVVLQLSDWSAAGHSGNYSLQDLESEREEIKYLSQTLHLQITNLINRIDAVNRDYAQNQLKRKIRALKRVFGGEISEDLHTVLPIDMLESSKRQLELMRESNEAFHQFILGVDESYTLALEAKTEDKPSSFANIAKVIKDKAKNLLGRPDAGDTNKKDGEEQDGRGED